MRANLGAFFIVLVSLPCLVLFQNCSNDYKINTAGGDSSQAAGTPPGGTGGTVVQPGGNGGTPDTLATTNVVFAVRAMNCIACHGVVDSSVITDFGYGSPNFIINKNFFSSGVRTAYNDSDVGAGSIGGWESLTINGTVYVPAITTPFSQTESSAMFGTPSVQDFVGLMSLNKPAGLNTGPMDALVTPPTGLTAVSTYSTITIAYPSQAEILNLLPSSLSGKAVAVSAINVASIKTPTTMSGLTVDTSGNFVRNSGSTVTCTGDVVIAGPLFLKNLNLSTDANGCRLYVSQTVFIQGPITYVGGVTGANLQITSATGIMMGFNAYRMGYSGKPGPWTTANPLRTNNFNPTPSNILYATPGGPWERFDQSLDSQYNPSGSPVNGVASTTFFDGLVSDALLIGSELLDAGDSAAVNNLVAGETVVMEANSSANSNNGGSRLSIDYSGLLLNAPHIHSRYFGTFEGVVVGEVAMLARNPTATAFPEKLTADPIFSKLNYLLPALTTTILVAK